MLLLTSIAAAGGFLVGAAVAWGFRSRKDVKRDEADWKTRIAARDLELRELRDQLADSVVALQEAGASGSPVASIHRQT